MRKGQHQERGVVSLGPRQVALEVTQRAGEGRKAQAAGCKPILRRRLLGLQEIHRADPFPLPGSRWPGH